MDKVFWYFSYDLKVWDGLRSDINGIYDGVIESIGDYFPVQAAINKIKKKLVDKRYLSNGKGKFRCLILNQCKITASDFNFSVLHEQKNL